MELTTGTEYLNQSEYYMELVKDFNFNLLKEISILLKELSDYKINPILSSFKSSSDFILNKTVNSFYSTSVYKKNGSEFISDNQRSYNSEI
jgi:hypothetical protein